MTKLLWKTLLAGSGALGAALAVSGNAIAAESATVDSVSDISSEVLVAEPIQLAQVTSVSELSDVQPSDWAYTALQRLVEEYGCLEGYPDRTFRGNRALTRFEFAAGLNACLDVIVNLIGTGPDLDAIRRLQEEFAAELATVRGDVDALQTDVAELEANQFSTTTKLRGQLDAHLVVPFDDTAQIFDDGLQTFGPAESRVATDNTIGGEEADATFEYRARLNFDTSFTGEDRLRIRLQASDDAGSLANTESGLANQSSRRGGGNFDGEDNIGLDDVYYSFPIGNRISGIIAANSVLTDDFVSSTIVPFDGPSVADAGGPEFYDLYEGGNFGAGVNIAFTRNLILDAGYSSKSSNLNTDGGGLFNNGSYIAQLNLLTDGIFNAAVTYIGATDAEEGNADNTIAGALNLDFGRFEIGGHYASTDVQGGGNADSYMGGIAITDLFGTGNQFGVYGGISPAVDRDPLLVEAYYQIAVNEFFTFTPAVIYADNDSDGDNSENVYGALRATFKF
ncbi:MAG: porin [Leptolyngbya foveolarum]|uniref:Porin n=1 Tax=Leptolyngbya foveolarum TaxID=47253 RepID=A0A2W4U6X8_9CYAN|nr:MAG: porin [Leptolyngbya foveolarum]